MKKIILLFLTLLVCTSCQDETISVYKEHANNYYKHNPDGYDPDANWYEYDQTSTSHDFNGNEKIFTKKFIGRIDFDKDSFCGKVYEYELKTNTITINNHETVSNKSTYSCWKDGNYYTLTEFTSLDETLNSKTSAGCNNFTDFIFRAHFKDDYFFPNLYEPLLSVSNAYYDSVQIYKNHITINISLLINVDGVETIQTDYFFDENYQLVQVIECFQKYMYKDYVGTLPYSTTISRLRFGSYKDIKIPTEYDVEYEYDENEIYWLYL